MTFLLPEDIEARELQLLQAITGKLGLSPISCNWVHTWTQVMAGGSEWVVSLGKAGLEEWHQWGQVQVNMHGTMFRRDHWNVMVGEHPGGGFQRTAWGYGVKEHLRDEIASFNAARMGLVDSDELLGKWCVRCLRGREGKRVLVHAYLHEADWIGLCERHWRKRAEVTKVTRERVKKGSREAQIEGQEEMWV